MKPLTFYHWLPPLALLFAATFFLDVLHLDLYVADRIYALQGHQWSLKHHWLLEDVMHKGGRNLVALLILLMLGFLIASVRTQALRPYQQGLKFLSTAVILSLIAISSLKGITHIDCPWSLLRYGGSEPSLAINAALFGNGSGRCFPAGHASGGYAWIALYFLCRHYWPRWRYAALLAALGLGGLYGLAQQLRGAHFLSHDLWTLALCWYISLTCYLIFLRRNPLPQPAMAG